MKNSTEREPTRTRIPRTENISPHVGVFGTTVMDGSVADELIYLELEVVHAALYNYRLCNRRQLKEI
jgi:hypothetical protein